MNDQPLAMDYDFDGVKPGTLGGRPNVRTSLSDIPAAGAGSDGPSRFLSVIVAIIGLVVALPLMVVVAVAIKMTSRGPVFFTQTRVGLDRRNRPKSPEECRRTADRGGKPFTIYKFRTMFVGSSAADAQVWASPDDARVTPIGRVLRKYRLDELPQLVNVIRGEMNIVGPRPEQPDLFLELREQVERYAERQRARPGITGWAQVNQSYDQDLEDVRNKVAFDLEYIHRRSVVEDVRIMLKTVPVIVFKKGAW